ncbi:MAG: ABC transporter permease [Prevotella sp.]|nr:ABC transporter permease [Prevotella sp.]
MNLPFFIAKRIYSDQGDKRKVSRPAIRIATIGVAIGLAVMIVTVSVVLGFKHTIRDKVIGFGSHIQVQNMLTFLSTDSYPIIINDSVIRSYEQIEGVKHAERYAYSQGILKTDDDFLGVMFKGVGPEYDLNFLSHHLLEGEMPVFSDTASTNKILISKMIADKLRLKAGDRIFAYFIGESVRTRRFTIIGIYQTNMTRFDESLCFTDLYTTRKLNDWEDDQCSGAEITVNDFDQLQATADLFIENVNRRTDKDFNTYSSQTIYEAYPQVFNWLELLDINVWIILVLMVCVAGFTMISGLLIIILERTQMIGVMKALGARNKTIRHTFLWFAAFIIGQGLLLGNVLGIGIIALQKYTGLVKLDPQTYYVSEAPMEVNIPLFVLLNIATLIICVFVLIAPSYFVSHIHPAKSMRYE